MAFWSGEKLEFFARSTPNFLANFAKEKIDCNAYTLNMGNEYFVTADSSDPARRDNHRRILDPYTSFVIPPGQFAFLLTEERVEIPDNVMAFISMKATYKFQGLINVSGFHVDPGYKGNLVFAVYNAGPAPVHLRDKLPLFLIWFADLDRASQMTRPAASEKSLSNDLLKGMSGEILSLQSLSKEIGDLKFTVKVQTALLTVAATIFFGLVIATANYVIQHGIDLTSKAPPPPSSITAPRP